jgi:ankyrin repeat protein
MEFSESSESSSVKLPKIPGAQPKSSSTSALPKVSARVAFNDELKTFDRETLSGLFTNEGFNIDEKFDINGIKYTLLSYAIINGNIDLLDFLLTARKNRVIDLHLNTPFLYPEYSNPLPSNILPKKYTPLAYASVEGRLDMIPMLLNRSDCREILYYGAKIVTQEKATGIIEISYTPIEYLLKEYESLEKEYKRLEEEYKQSKTDTLTSQIKNIEVKIAENDKRILYITKIGNDLEETVSTSPPTNPPSSSSSVRPPTSITQPPAPPGPAQPGPAQPPALPLYHRHLTCNMCVSFEFLYGTGTSGVVNLLASFPVSRNG